MIYVMSDIHGNITGFEDILSQIELRPEDTLYILGDVIDRGKHGIEILIRIMNSTNIKMLLGNHEYMLLNSLNPVNPQIVQNKRNLALWRRNHSKFTEKELGNLNIDMYQKLYAFLDSLPLNIDVKVGDRKYTLVHGSPVKLYNHSYKYSYVSEAEFAVWNRLMSIPREFDAIVVFGHTPTINYQDGLPLRVYKGQNMIGIDCGSGWTSQGHDGCTLACLRLDDMKEFYSK